MRPRWKDHLRPEVGQQPGQYSKTVSLKKKRERENVSRMSNDEDLNLGYGRMNEAVL